MAAARSARPAALADVPAPDDVADVLVVGYGCAGACAAVEAARAGADVLVLDRFSGPGGTSALSGGELYLGGGTALQADSGVADTQEAMAAYLRQALGPGVDEAKLAAYVGGSREHYDWLVEAGVPFQPGVYDEPSWMPPTDDGLMWLGERSWPFRELATPAPRGHRPATGHFGGWLLMDRLAAAARDAGARTAPDVLVERLVLDGDRVAGVVARQYGEPRVYLARRGVVLATGGFVDDDGMLADHAPQLLGMEKISCGGEDGSGIRMAQAVGAAVRHMGSGQVGLHAVPALMARGIVVNGEGQRFVAEDSYPGRIGQAVLFRQGMPCWTILDQAAFEAVPESERWGVLPHHTADTAEELGAQLGMPPGALAATIELYNRAAARGQDPAFHKDPRWLRPLEPPYAAIDPRRSFRGPDAPATGSGAAVFTLGGLATDVAGRVLHVDGDPIPGLLAAGRVTSGLATTGYVSGTSLGDGSFFGRAAGRSAAVDQGPADRDADRRRIPAQP